jgi:vesicle coat complex subunit
MLMPATKYLFFERMYITTVAESCSALGDFDIKSVTFVQIFIKTLLTKYSAVAVTIVTLKH